MQPLPGPLVDARRLVAASGPAVFQRGQEYFRAGRVRTVRWSPGAQEAGSLSAEVEGSGSVYSVTVRVGTGGAP
ncbi:hypothetical protein ACFP5Z_08505, partial [Kocuria oceani]